MDTERKTSIVVGAVVTSFLVILIVIARMHPQGAVANSDEPVANNTMTSATTSTSSVVQAASTDVENLPSTPTITSTPPAALYTGGPLVSFSFDDGWQSGYTNGLPVLASAGFNGTFYIISTRVGASQHITKEELLQMQAAGNEIGAHTRTHPDLSKLSDSEAETEIAGSRQDLLGIGIQNVSTFAYPYGGHDASTPGLVQAAGLIGARSSRTGLNNDKTNPYLLLSFNLTASTTLAMAEQEIDVAIAQKQWLIFEMHHIDESSYDNISSALLQQIVDYIRLRHVRVTTVRDGLIALNKNRK